MDLCTTNFRNYHSLKDSSGPGAPALPKQSRIMWPSSDQWIPFQASHRAAASGTFARFCHPRPRPSWVSYSLCIPHPPTQFPLGGSGVSVALPALSLCPERNPTEHSGQEPPASQ